MKTHQAINQLLSGLSVVIRQRHLPDLADVCKQAAVLVNSIHTTSLEAIDEKVAKLIKDFEAKIVASGDVSAQDLVMAVAEPAISEDEDFTPLPDEVDQEVLDATIIVRDPKVRMRDLEAETELEVQVPEEEDFLAELDEELDDA